MNEYRLSYVLKELNIGISTLIEFFQSYGVIVEINPNAKITEDQYLLAKNYFNEESEKKLPADEISGIITDEEILIEEKEETISGILSYCLSIKTLIIYYDENYFSFKDMFTDIETISFNEIDKLQDINENSYQLILINFDFSYSSKANEEKNPLSLIKKLRIIKKFKVPIVSYGFLSFHTIIQRSPENCLLTATGNYYIQLPVNSHSINKLLLNIVDRAKARVDNEIDFFDSYKEILKRSEDFLKTRHVFANWWGFDRLCRIYQMLYPQTGFSISELLIKKRESLEYKIMEFICSNKNDYSNANNKELEKSIKDKLASIRTRKGKTYKVMLIDDLAGIGWSVFFQQLFGKESSIVLNTIAPQPNQRNSFITDTSNKLKDTDLLILDFRLFPEEETITDYKNLESIKLLYFLRSNKNYNRLKIMFFTASNKLHQYMTVLHGSKYAPQALFIKESPDQLMNKKDSLNNFHHLVNSLFDIICRKRQKKDEIQMYDASEDEELKRIWNNIPRNLSFDKDAVKFFKVFNDYDRILFDTNIFLQKDNMKLAWYCLSSFNSYKFVVPSIVYEELKWIAEEDQRNDQREKNIIASFFEPIIKHRKYDLNYQYKIPNQRTEGIADKYLPMIINYHSVNHSHERILFVTSDWTINPNKKEISAPGVQIRNMKLPNVTVIKPSEIIFMKVNTSKEFHTKDKNNSNKANSTNSTSISTNSFIIKNGATSKDNKHLFVKFEGQERRGFIQVESSIERKFQNHLHQNLDLIKGIEVIKSNRKSTCRFLNELNEEELFYKMNSQDFFKKYKSRLNSMNS